MAEALHLINLINLIILHILVIPATLFPPLYFFRSHWRATLAGKATMISTTALMLLVDVSVAGRYLRLNAHPLILAVITLVVFLLVLTGSAVKLGVLIWAQHQDRKEN